MVSNSTIELSHNNTIYLEHEEIRNVYFLAKGTIVTYKSHPEKNISMSFQIIRVGSFFGYLEVIIGGRLRRQSASVISRDALIEVYEVNNFRNKIINDRMFYEDIISAISLHRNEIWKRILVMRNYHSSKKIAWMLLEMSTPIKDEENKVVIEYFTHKLLGDYTGSSRQTITTTLNEFRRLGIIEYNTKHIIINELEMKKLIQ